MTLGSRMVYRVCAISTAGGVDVSINENVEEARGSKKKKRREKSGSTKSGKPCTDNLRRSRSTTGVITGGSTGNDNDDLLLQLIDPGSSNSVSSLMVGVN